MDIPQSKRWRKQERLSSAVNLEILKTPVWKQTLLERKRINAECMNHKKPVESRKFQLALFMLKGSLMSNY